MPFIFIVHHLSIVLQSVDDRRATAVCTLIIRLAISWADIHIAILCQTEAREACLQHKVPCSLIWKWAISTSHLHDISGQLSHVYICIITLDRMFLQSIWFIFEFVAIKRFTNLAYLPIFTWVIFAEKACRTL